MARPLRRLRARASVLVAAALTGIAALTPARADSQMRQSPLLMRRAGPSCQPGDLGAEPGAGYFYRLGPCAGPDTSGAAPDALPVDRRRARAYRRGLDR